jgi:hypothetical protein
MTRRPTDLEEVRLALRGLSRGDPLVIAERAVELVCGVNRSIPLSEYWQNNSPKRMPARALPASICYYAPRFANRRAGVLR